MAIVLGGLGAAQAGPGPENVAILAAADDAESLALGERYRAARGVPAGQLCPVAGEWPEDVDLATFRAGILDPLWACLGEHRDRISVVVAMRGLPLRVAIPTEAGPQRVSLTAALMTWGSTDAEGAPILGAPPGQPGNCGNAPCLAARWRNPWTTGPFEAGASFRVGATTWRPVLATMLHGRSAADAERLLDSALGGEAAPPTAPFVLMRAADGARGALDFEFEAVVEGLAALGVDAEILPFDAALTGRSFGGFAIGTASLGATIEGNDFAPGALVDNLTSFGALPENFRAEGEAQVSIARWVARGVAGVHGTTDEPLNNCFPSRHFLVDYAAGDTLAEAYHRNLPFVYWRNLVLGDPLAAPFAARPAVSLDWADGAPGGALTATATAAAGRAVTRLDVYRDGAALRWSRGQPIEVCVASGDAPVEVLVVAEDDGPQRSKGWAWVEVPAGRGCATPDAGLSDAGDDDGASPDAAVDAAPDVPEPSVDGAAEVADGPLADADPDGAARADPETSGGGCRGVDAPGSLGWWLGALLLGLRRRSWGLQTPARSGVLTPPGAETP